MLCAWTTVATSLPEYSLQPLIDWKLLNKAHELLSELFLNSFFCRPKQKLFPVSHPGFCVLSEFSDVLGSCNMGNVSTRLFPLNTQIHKFFILLCIEKHFTFHTKSILESCFKQILMTDEVKELFTIGLLANRNKKLLLFIFVACILLFDLACSILYPFFAFLNATEFYNIVWL